MPQRSGPRAHVGAGPDGKTTDPRLLEMCKPPVAACRGTGDRPFDVLPGHPDQSIMAFRMESTDPGEMMPELRRSLTHKEGTELVFRYIAATTGSCDEDAPISEGTTAAKVAPRSKVAGR